MPVFITVKAKMHRTTMGFDLPKIGATTPTVANGQLSFEVEMTGDDKAIEVVNHNLPAGHEGFFFQPSFGPGDAENVSVSVACLHFSKENMESVVTNAATAVQLHSVTGGVGRMGQTESTTVYQRAHIVLVVVADDSHYEDLSAHPEPPTVLNTGDGRPNVMPVPFHKFVPGWSPSFVAPRLSVATLFAPEP
jgi:hypothetical protein